MYEFGRKRKKSLQTIRKFSRTALRSITITMCVNGDGSKELFGGLATSQTEQGVCLFAYTVWKNLLYSSYLISTSRTRIRSVWDCCASTRRLFAKTCTWWLSDCACSMRIEHSLLYCVYFYDRFGIACLQAPRYRVVRAVYGVVDTRDT